MQIKIVLSTGKELELTRDEMTELLNMPECRIVYVQPQYPQWAPWWGGEYPRIAWDSTGNTGTGR